MRSNYCINVRLNSHLNSLFSFNFIDLFLSFKITLHFYFTADKFFYGNLFRVFISVMEFEEQIYLQKWKKLN